MATLRGAACRALPLPPSLGSVAGSNMRSEMSQTCSPVKCRDAVAPLPEDCAISSFQNKQSKERGQEQDATPVGGCFLNVLREQCMLGRRARPLHYAGSAAVGRPTAPIVAIRAALHRNGSVCHATTSRNAVLGGDWGIG